MNERQGEPKRGNLRILIAHSHYGDYVVGGEGAVMSAEADMLAQHGHEVLRFERTNAQRMGKGLINFIDTARHMYWSPQAYEEIGAVMDEFRPDVLHVHNYHISLTPAVFVAAKRRGIATVMTLHNYRLICPTGQFLRNGKICESCLEGGWAWRPILSRCYPGGGLVKTIAAVHQHRLTKKDKRLADRIDAYIALTNFAAKKHVGAGIPASQMHVKPNFMADPFAGREPSSSGHGAVYLGRLSPEKGVDVLMRAWRGIDYPLSVIGDGPDMGALRAMAPPQVTFTGQLDKRGVLERLEAASFLVLPSLWYEGFPLVLVEAMACGLAIIATDLGGRAEIVPADAGLMCEAGNAASLATAIKTLIGDPALCVWMGENARRFFLERFTAEPNYERLIEIYSAALGHARSSHSEC
jgi:glycosyltransferase involved in cell wall biosynthesis